MNNNERMKYEKEKLYNSLGISENAIRNTENRWIVKYDISQNDSIIALKALELLLAAIKKNVFSDETKEALDVLMDKVLNMANPNTMEKVTLMSKKINEAQQEMTDREYLMFMVDYSVAWIYEIRQAIVKNDKELMTNAVNYTVSIERAIMSHFLTLYELNKEALMS